jgi:hypothetical protein
MKENYSSSSSKQAHSPVGSQNLVIGRWSGQRQGQHQQCMQAVFHSTRQPIMHHRHQLLLLLLLLLLWATLPHHSCWKPSPALLARLMTATGEPSLVFKEVA